MIPKKIQIKNFLSYGPETQTIDFLHYNLICLSGKNGHGKSALLDAMTWALWGQARKTTGTSKADEGLVHLGQKHMLITFDFEINNTAYKVRREFVKTQSAPFSALDFGIVKADGTFTTMTDKTIKATQIKLEKTIGITYDSFINSAFLRQGQANEFSKKSPKERKEILATILQLERFEDLKKIALEKTKQLNYALLQKQTIYDRITQELSALSTDLQAQPAFIDHCRIIDAQQTAIKKQLVNDERIKEQLLQLHKTYEFLQLQKQQEEKKYKEVELQVTTLKALYKTVQERQKQGIDVITLQKLCLQAQNIVNEHQIKLTTRLELKDLYLTTQEKKQNITKQIDTQLALYAATYQAKTKLLEDQSAEFDRQIIQQTKIFQDLAEQIKKLEAQIAATALHHCPLCEQQLSTKQTKILIKKLQEQQTVADTNIKKLTIDMIATQAQIKLAETEYHTILINYEKSENKIIVQSLTEKLEQLKQKGIALGYDKDLHDKDAQQLQIYQTELAKLENLQKEIGEQTQRAHQIEQLNIELGCIELSLNKITQQLLSIKDCPNQLIDQIKLHHEHQLQAQTIADEKAKLLEQKAVFELQTKRLESCSIEQKTIEKAITQLNLELIDFADIVKALGKDGLQALLIEQALPEIEQEANILLAQLTDNQTQLYIESLRDLKKGGSKETLDIKISDAIGLRPYEMFSGGEAFRIDFALRIAISKLLARRAGTALQTLIIDEGFGSQDDDGLQLIMDSILKIQDNFAKVIIVSHLPAMKEQFPVQFLVEKKASGSVVTVIEQG